MKRHIFFIVITTLLIPFIGQAQEENTLHQEEIINPPTIEIDTNSPAGTFYPIKVLSRSYGDSIVLRWLVEDPGVWMLSNGHGWQVSTFKSSCDTCYEEMVFIGGDTIRAMTLEEMQAKFSPENLIAGVAAQALYGHSVFPTKQSPGQGFTDFVFRRHQEQTQRQFLAYFAAEQDAQVASALGMRVVDKNVKIGESYEYTILSNIPKELANIAGVTTIVKCTPFVRSIDEMIPEIQFLQIDPYRAIIYCAKNRLSGYFFERSSDNGKTWVKLNEAAVYPSTPNHETRAVFGDYIAELMETNVILFDSLDINKKYKYRVKAFDAFADYAPEKISTEFEMMDFIPPSAPVIANVIPSENTQCTINWYKDEIEPDFNNFVVAFSESLEGPWSNISEALDKNTRTYVDKEAGKRGRGLYKVFCSDINGNFSYSNAHINYIEDVTPPKAPKNLWAEVDTLGIMKLYWSANKEKDLRGYKVYAANQEDHDFVEISNGYLSDNEFIDTVDIKMLTKHLYCYVIAYDNNHNYSLPSDTLEVKFPDLLPPGIVILEDYTLNEGKLTARWRKSVSDDVVNYFIYRKPENQTRWECIYIATPEDVNKDGLIVISDNPKPSVIPYQYAVEALDDSKNSSGITGSFTIFVSGPSIIDVDIDLTAEANKKKNSINLKWKYEYTSQFEHYGVIYRSVNGGEYQDIYSFQRGEKNYQDSDVKSGDNVRYYIQLMLGRGKRSTPSKEVKIKL